MAAVGKVIGLSSLFWLWHSNERSLGVGGE